MRAFVWKKYVPCSKTLNEYLLILRISFWPSYVQVGSLFNMITFEFCFCFLVPAEYCKSEWVYYWQVYRSLLQTYFFACYFLDLVPELMIAGLLRDHMLHIGSCQSWDHFWHLQLSWFSSYLNMICFRKCTYALEIYSFYLIEPCQIEHYNVSTEVFSQACFFCTILYKLDEQRTTHIFIYFRSNLRTKRHRNFH